MAIGRFFDDNRKVFLSRWLIPSEPVRAALILATRKAHLKQAEPTYKASHFKRMTLITMENQMLKRRVQLRKLRTRLGAEIKPGAKSQCRREEITPILL